MNEFIQLISEYQKYTIKEYYENFGTLDTLLQQLNKEKENDENKKEQIINHIKKELSNCPEYMQVHLLSFLTRYASLPLNSAEYVNQLLEIVLASESLTVENLFFIYYQFISLLFDDKNVGNSRTKELMHDLYNKVYNVYHEAFQEEFTFIKKEERNERLVFVLTPQFLNQLHAPSKIALDICETLFTKLNKIPYLINTAEVLPLVGVYPLFLIDQSNYINDYSAYKEYNYKNLKIPFLQCEYNMPNMDSVHELLSVVLTEKPYCIINISGNSIVSDICSNVVPTITYPTSFELSMTKGQFQILFRSLAERDMLYLQRLGKTKEHVIVSHHTYSFVPQTHTYTRKELNLPNNKFIISIVGNRLDIDITNEFAEFLNRIINPDICIAFIGGFEKHKDYWDRFELWKKHTVSLGIQKDLLAAMECCDLYVNPPRSGGGTSGVMALFKGLPVVTLGVGDVAMAVGKAFWVEDFDEMEKQIIRYTTDKPYYSKMSDIAVKRAKEMTDDENSSFIDAFRTAESRDAFN